MTRIDSSETTVHDLSRLSKSKPNPNTLTGLRQIKAECEAKAKAQHALVIERRDEYVADIKAKFAELTAIIEKHHSGDDINWGDVGSLNHMLEQLTYLTESYKGL